MPVWTWIVIAAVIVVAVVAVMVVTAASRRKRTEGLKSRFGPEYDRAVHETGDERSATKELAAREQRRAKLDIRPLTPEARNGYANRWRAVQTAFVDHPSSAVGEADILVSELMRERGYPVDDFDRQADAVSVDHPTVVENYRAAHDIHLAQQREDVGTEQQRQAFVHYRTLFAQLLETQDHQNTSPEARA